MKNGIILFGVTGACKTYVLNNHLAQDDYFNINMKRSWSNKKDLYEHIEKCNDVIIDNEGLNVEQLYKCIKELKSKGYNVEVIYIKSTLKDIKQRVNNNIIYDEYETLSSAIEIITMAAGTIKTINN